MIAKVAAVAFGALLKIYDDMEDNPVIAKYATSQFMEIIKALIIMSFTYASIHNIHLPIIIFIAHCLHYVITDDHAISTDFYHAGMIVAFLLSIISFDVSTLNIVSFALPILYVFIGAYLDHILCPEEYSWKKIIWRSIISIALIVLLLFSTYVPDYDIVFFTVGYSMISIPFMIYAQTHEPSKETKETKETKEHPQSPSEKDIHLPMESST